VEAELRHPSVIDEYVRTYHDEWKSLPARLNAKWAQLELRLAISIERLTGSSRRQQRCSVLARVLDEEPKQVARELNDEPA
jgi:hypothetical protein